MHNESIWHQTNKPAERIWFVHAKMIWRHYIYRLSSAFTLQLPILLKCTVPNYTRIWRWQWIFLDKRKRIFWIGESCPTRKKKGRENKRKKNLAFLRALYKRQMARIGLNRILFSHKLVTSRYTGEKKTERKKHHTVAVQRPRRVSIN